MMQSIIDPKIFTLIIFVLAYALFVAFPRRRTWTAFVCAALLILLNIISFKQAFFSINWNVMGIFFGTLVITDLFLESRVPAYIAENIVDGAKNTAWAILFICLLTGFISAFVENVAAVLIVAPIAFSLASKLKINPTNMMIAIAISSNLQGCATLIGDPPSMLLGGFAKMNFMDFFFYQGRPSIFFAVEIGAIASFVVLYFIFRGLRKKTSILKVEKVRSWVPTAILVLLVVFLALSSFFDVNFSYLAGIICMVFGAFSVVWDRVANKKPIIRAIEKLDWDTGLFLASVFVLVGSITLSGWITIASEAAASAIGANVAVGFFIIVAGSVLLSAFIDNVPFLAAMLPLAIHLSQTLGIASSLYLFGLLIGASLGGNITPIGASANIVACSLLKKEGHIVSFGEFARIGLPFTIAAVSAATAFVWFIWR